MRHHLSLLLRQTFSTSTSGLSLAGGDITTAGNASTALAAIDSAISTVNSALSTLGAGAKRIEIVWNIR